MLDIIDPNVAIACITAIIATLIFGIISSLLSIRIISQFFLTSNMILLFHLIIVIIIISNHYM